MEYKVKEPKVIGVEHLTKRFHGLGDFRAYVEKDKIYVDCRDVRLVIQRPDKTTYKVTPLDIKFYPPPKETKKANAGGSPNVN